VITFIFLYFYKPTTLQTIETSGTNFLSEFFPFGKNTNTPGGNKNTPADISGLTPSSIAEGQKEALVKVSSMPIAGYGIFSKERYKEIPENIPPVETQPEIENGNTETPTTPNKETVAPTPPATEFVTALRYVERATSNIYQTFADKIDERKFTTTIIPSVYETYFSGKGENAVIRYLKKDEKTIASFASTLPTEILGGDTTSLGELKGSFLPENITDISISPDGSSIFYLFEIENGVVGVTASSSGDKKNQIFNSPFTEWLTSWPNDRMITLTTKPTFRFPGYMYYLDPVVKKLTKVLGGINGLTTLTSPSGKLILYNDNQLSLSVYNIDTKESFSLGIKTLPEKCTWDMASANLYCFVPKNIEGTQYPDVWYQGEISFLDDIWKVNAENGSTTILAKPAEFQGGEEIDGIKPSLDEGENYLFFVNKKDSYLWELNLK